MNSWFWLAVLASFCWGLTYVFDQYLLRSLDPLMILFLSTFFICVMLGIYLIFTQQWQVGFDKFAGNYKLMGMFAAYTIFYLIAAILILKSIHAGNASLAAVIESAYPLFTIAFAYLILREIQFNWGVLVGTGLILSGLIVVQLTNSH